MEQTHTTLTRIIYFCLAIAGACLFTLTSLSSPALADDTDGGSGQGSGAGADGCIKSGWRLVNDIDDLVWQDNGAGRECGNTAYANRTTWTHREFTDETGTLHVCDTRGGSYQTNCNGDWRYQNTPVYSALGNMGANACYRRTDLHGIWYLQDAGLEAGSARSWTNLGDGPDGGHRTVTALRDAINGGPELVDSATRGDAAWWDSRISAWQGEKYEANVAYYVRAGQPRAQAIASVRADAKAKLAATIKDVTGGNNPVIFCWYGTVEKSGMTCAEQMPSGMAWNDYLHPAGITQSSTGVTECIRRCPTAQGQYPTALPHAGEYIPNANGSRSPRPASNSEDDIANYCYPPISITWHQGGYGSEIPGIGYVVQSTHGSNATATQPYTYVTSAEDGNSAYNSATKTGNAPGQGQFSASTATKKTAFGSFMDTYCSGSPSCLSGQIGDPGSASYNRFVAGYNAAVAALPTEAHATLDLTTEQQAQVARGRILNVVERTVYASAEARRLLDRFHTRAATRTVYYTLTGSVRTNTTIYTAWTYDPAAHPAWDGEAVPSDLRGVYRPTFSDGSTFASGHPDIQKWDHQETVYGSTPKPTGFWQNGVTHCNAQEFSTLNPSGTASGTNDTGVLDTGDTSQYYSASAVSKIQDSAYAVTTPAVDFTRARWGQTTTNASAKPAFFDRLCAYPGSATNPLTMTPKTTATQGSFVFFRDGQKYTVEGTNGEGDSPFFVPDFKGEDRNSTVTTVTGYTAKKSIQTAPDTWTLTYEEKYQSGTTPIVPATAPYYYGSYIDRWTCSPGTKKNPCTGGPINARCDHSQTLYNGTYGPQAAPLGTYYLYSGCVLRSDYPSYYPGTPQTGGDPIYPWRAGTASTQYSQADADAAYSYCVAQQNAGNRRSCTVTKTNAVWTTPATTSVPSCPMTDTATERYTDCTPVTRTDTVTTNYNVVEYNNEDPTQVIVTRDPLSTPDASLATLYGLTNSGTSSQLFSEDASDTRTPKTDGVYQSQFAPNPNFSSSTVAVASGTYKRLQVKAVWAADKNRPQVLTIASYFTPNVRSTFAMTNVGFGRPGGLMSYTKGEYSTPVRGRVEALANSLTTDVGSTLASYQNRVWANTGTNIEDELNVPLAYGADRQVMSPFAWRRDPSTVNGHYFTVDIRRATQQ